MTEPSGPVDMPIEWSIVPFKGVKQPRCSSNETWQIHEKNDRGSLTEVTS
jgi:hypothetical protein